MGLLSHFKRNKTLRSLLGATAFFAAGVPSVTKATSVPAEKVVQFSQTDADCLVQNYMPLCCQLEDNLSYCYKDRGVLSIGAGVHIKDYSALNDLYGIKLVLKKGTIVNLKDRSYLEQLANANWNDPRIKNSFPEVKGNVKIKLKDCAGQFPSGGDKIWTGNELVVVPYQTREIINKTAIEFNIQKALKYHPNLFKLPPIAQLVVLDLIYNLGYDKYFRTYPKFQKAVETGDLQSMKGECGTRNKRRDSIRKSLLNTSLLLVQEGSKMTQKQLSEEIRDFMVKENPKLSPKLEPELWMILDEQVFREFNWKMNQLTLKSKSIPKLHDLAKN